MKKDKFIRDFKIYNFVMSNIWQLLTTLLIGFGIGWLLEKYVGSEKNLFMIFSVIIGLVIGIANFFFSLYRKMKELQKKEENKPNVAYIKYEEEDFEDEKEEEIKKKDD